jgi:hypothetical protein
MLHSDPDSALRCSVLDRLPARELGDHTDKQIPAVEPLRVDESPKDGVSVNSAPHSDNPDRTMGLH